MGWVRGPVSAIRGAAACKRLAAALLEPLSAVALLAATCENNGEPVDTVTPFGSIASPDGGRSLPDPARVLRTNANQDLMTGNFAAAAQVAQRARQETRNEPRQHSLRVAPPGAGEVTGCIAITVAPEDGRVGDDPAAERSLNKALLVAPGRANVIVKELCQAARKPSSITRCVTAPKPSEPPTVAPSRRKDDS